MARIRAIKPDFWTDEKVVDGCFYIYVISEHEDRFQSPCKVGIATNINKRLSSLQGGNHRQLHLHSQITINDRFEALEAEFHCLSKYKSKRLMSEWVDTSAESITNSLINFLNADEVRFKKDMK